MGFGTAQGDQQSSKAESEPKEVKAETEEKEEKDLEENNEGWRGKAVNGVDPGDLVFRFSRLWNSM